MGYDFIHAPPHYDPFSCGNTHFWHKKLLSKDEYIGYLKGMIIKYRMRAGNKPSVDAKQDIEKAKSLEKELKELKNEPDNKYLHRSEKSD